MNMRRLFSLFSLTFALSSLPLGAAHTSARFALILADKPAAKAVRSGGRRDALEVVSARQQIRAKQEALRSQLEAKGIHVTGSTDTLLNAVYVTADLSDVPALRTMPGVQAVFPLGVQRLKLNTAVNLIDAPAAWDALGGIPNAGAGKKIGIIDTGIDQNHPAFQDPTLTAPANYPPVGSQPNVPAFTNSKVIVARSYVPLEVGTGPAVSTPDDVSPRDRVGHGTAVAMCAGGNTNTGPLATITGLAPKAFLGNYKVFGSPGIIDGAYTDAIIKALEDAFKDGMDVVNISSGGPTFSAPLENDAFCTALFGTSQCDPEAIAVENAVESNMVVVAAGGNEGQNGFFNGVYTYDTTGSPAYAPDAIAVAATGNSHQPSQSIHIFGANLPGNLTTIPALADTATFLSSAITGTIIDASTVGDVYGCTAFPVNSMQGDIALIQRGGTPAACTFDEKLINAANAGATAVLLYNNGQLPDLFSPTLTNTTLIPSYFIGTSNGMAVKAYVDSNAAATASLDPSAAAFEPSSDTNQVAFFSSRGPALGFGLKPDVAAPGENIYMAAQTYDPQGALYDPSGYTTASGTSFSSPIVAGVAAMVRQSNPSFTAKQVRSAIINTATNDTTDPFVSSSGAPSGVLSVGGGKVEALHAIQTNVTAEPATISFGNPTGTVNATQPITITNFSPSSLTLTIGVTRTTPDAATTLSVSAGSITLAPNANGTVSVSLSGSKPVPGIYQGAITITGGAQPLHVPYLYVVGDGVPYEVIPLAGDNYVGSFPGVVNGSVSDGFSAFQVIDQYGVPVANLPVTWAATSGNGSSVTNADSTTNQYGEAIAQPILGSVPGTYTYRATITGLNLNGQSYYDFNDDAIAVPTINTGGIVNAGSNAVGSGIAPGSYISVYGVGFATSSNGATYVPLPISISNTSVGFDAVGVSVPGPLTFLGPNQINVQVPWELAGQSSAQIKVYIEPNLSNLVTVPVTTYSPALFVVNGIAAATNVTDGSVVTADNAAKRGQYISLYCNGLGPVTNQPATGAVAPGAPAFAQTPQLPTVSIGGQPATVLFSGLAPGFVGLYQVNVLVPANIAAGEVPLVLAIGGVTAPKVNIPVQ